MTDNRRWFHVTITTYGSWLPGDPRGFRTRHHREHVDGDYKRPPREDYSQRHAKNRSRCKVPPVVVMPEQRRLIVLAVHERLTDLDVLLVAVAMSGRHGHILGKFPPKLVKSLTGFAKQHAFFTLRERGWSGPLWAKGRGVEPVHSRSHQRNALHYIVRHRRVGAYVWRWGEPIERLNPPLARGGL